MIVLLNQSTRTSKLLNLDGTPIQLKTYLRFIMFLMVLNIYYHQTPPPIFSHSRRNLLFASIVYEYEYMGNEMACVYRIQLQLINLIVCLRTPPALPTF